MEKLDFAKYYDVTDFARVRSLSHIDYEKIFICIGVDEFWIGRIVMGCRYDKNKGHNVIDKEGILLELNTIPKGHKSQGIATEKELEELLQKDNLRNVDCLNVDSIEEAIEMLDDGFGMGVLELTETV